jgi:carbon storage regulator
MLVLSRQRDETIMIGDDVEITVVDIRGDKVRLGINAPRQIQVHRKEVWEAIKRENEQAAKLKPHDVSDVIERDADSPGRGDGPVGGEKDRDKDKPEKTGNGNKAHDGDPNRSNQVGRSR